MKKISASEVAAALKNTLDPEIGINIVDLGLIYGIRVGEQSEVEVKITMTSPTCPLMEVILSEVQLRLENLAGPGKVKLELVWEPPWNPKMMSDEYRIPMGF